MDEECEPNLKMEVTFEKEGRRMTLIGSAQARLCKMITEEVAKDLQKQIIAGSTTIFSSCDETNGGGNGIGRRTDANHYRLAPNSMEDTRT